MGIGIGIFLVAVGAVLAFAVNATVSGVDIQTVGIILLIVGILGIALDLIMFAPRRRAVTRTAPVRDTTTVIDRDVY
jgi:hypothetical protein